ncbi:MAG: hypothetical protein RIS35_2392 [Pseudomonadota bacterium]|jgi:hypothetical protein
MRSIKAGSIPLVALLVAACGGGGGGTSTTTAVAGQTQTASPAPAASPSPAPAPSPAAPPAPGPSPVPAPPPVVTPDAAAGFWNGSTETGRSLTGAVLDDGTYYLFYSAANNANALGGFLHGTGSTTAGSFASSNTRDFNLEGPALLDASLQSTVVPRSSFNGTVTYTSGAGVSGFRTSFDTDYDIVPSLTSLAGTYSGVSGGSAVTVTMTVASDGAIVGSSSGGCRFTGSASPRSRGNAYDFTLTFGAVPCDLVGQTLKGVGLYDASLRQLLAVGLDTGRTTGFIFLGTKPAVATRSIDAKSATALPSSRGFHSIVGGEPLVTFAPR